MDVDPLRPKESPERKLQRAACHWGKGSSIHRGSCFSLDFQQTGVLRQIYRHVTNTWLSIYPPSGSRSERFLFMYLYLEADASSLAALNLSTQSQNTKHLFANQQTFTNKRETQWNYCHYCQLVHKGAHFCGDLFCISCGSMTTFNCGALSR